jgi:hypothetical protein
VEALGEVRNRTNSEATYEAYDRGDEPALSGEAQFPLGDVCRGDGFGRSFVFLPGEISRSPCERRVSR